MDENPIKYSDLIQPDDSIEKLVKQLDEANEAYNNLAGSIRAQAVSISSSLNSISGATESGRKATRQYSESAEKLLKAERDLNFARSETARKIAELNAARKAEQTEVKLLERYNRAAEGSYDKLAAQYGLLKMQLNAMSAEQRKNTEEGRKMEKQANAIYEEMKRLQEATGKHTLNVGNYTGAIDKLIGVQSGWFSQLQNLGGLFQGGLSNAIKMAGEQVAVFGKQLLALLANPIVATIAAVAAAFMALSKGISSSEENTNALNRVLAPFNRLLEFGLNLLQGFATAILKVVEGFENMAMGASRMLERLPLVGNAIKKVNTALQENINLEREKQDLQKNNRKLTVQEAKTQYEISVLRRKANQTDDPKERVALLQKAINKENQMSANRVAHVQRELAVLRKKAQQSQNDSAMNDEIARKEAELWNIRTQAEQRNFRMVRQIHNAENKMNNAGGGGVKVGSGVNDGKRIADEKLAIERKTQEIRLQMIEDDFSREYAIITNNYNVQIEELRKKGEKEVELREAINAEILALEAQRDIKLADLTVKYGEKQAQEEKKLKEQKERAAQEVFRTQVDVIDKETDLQQLQIDNMEASENKKTELRIKAEKERLKKIYDLNLKAGKDLTSLDMQLLAEEIKKLDKEAEKNRKNRDMFDMLGFNVTDEQKEAITSSFDFAKEQLTEYIDAWVEAANKKVELAAKEVESAQSALDAERQARAEGYASNVAYAQKELDDAKKNQEKALKEQERAQRAQQALQTIQQMTNLVSASALIWSQLGFPWAIPAIAVMWTSFAAAKIKAAQLTKSNSEQYGEGTVELLEGGSHQSGNDIDLGRKKDGTRRRAEGGEFFAVINKRSSRKYRKEIPDVIRALNNGTFEEKYSGAYRMGDGVVVGMQQSPDLRELSDDVQAIREQGERRTFTDSRGTHIFYKNLHRVVTN